MSDDKKSKKGSAKYDGLLNVFDDKKEADEPSTQVPKSDDTQTPKLDSTSVPKKESGSKSRNQLLKEGEMKQVKLLIDTETYKRFRIANIDLGTDMSETAERLMQQWLEAYERGEVER